MRYTVEENGMTFERAKFTMSEFVEFEQGLLDLETSQPGLSAQANYVIPRGARNIQRASGEAVEAGDIDWHTESLPLYREVIQALYPKVEAGTTTDES